MSDPALTLRYAEEPATGLPRLEDPSGRLSPEDAQALRGALARHFERLASGPDDQLFTLDAAVSPDLPRHFRVTVQQRGKRCPTLLLEAIEPTLAESLQDRPKPAGRWQSQLLAELADLLA